MKKILIVVLAVMSIFCVSATAMAVVLPPSNVSSAGLSAPITTLPIAELLNIPFTGVDVDDKVWFTGFLTQRVYKESAGLLFTYEFSNDADSLDAILLLSTQDFTGFTTDVDVEGATDWTLKRSLSGSTLSFLAAGDGVLPDDASPLLWVQTNANYYTFGSTQLQDGGNARVSTYAPSAVPEVSSMMLLGMGILGLFGFRRKA